MITLTAAEAALYHALLMQAAADAEAIGKHAEQMRTIAARLLPSSDLPETNRSSHQS